MALEWRFGRPGAAFSALRTKKIFIVLPGCEGPTENFWIDLDRGSGGHREEQDVVALILGVPALSVDDLGADLAILGADSAILGAHLAILGTFRLDL